MSSRAPAAAAGGEGADRLLWAKAAELERDFAGYKRRLAERRAQAAAAEVAAARADEDEAERRGAGDAPGRGRRYEEYVRRRDERLRHEWRARMERKEAEVQALWARLDRTGSRGRLRGGGGELAAASHAGEVNSRTLFSATLSLPSLQLQLTSNCFPIRTEPTLFFFLHFSWHFFFHQMVDRSSLFSFSCFWYRKLETARSRQISARHYLFSTPFG